MKVDVEVRAMRDFPSVEGPHELAWSHILDEIFADAYGARIDSLLLQLPSFELLPEVELRSRLTPMSSHAGCTGLACLTGAVDAASNADRIYHLHFGLLAPRVLRRTSAPRIVARERSRVLSVYTWKVLVWGIPINLANRAARPDFADRALCAMRRDFASPWATPSYYQLSTWVRR